MNKKLLLITLILVSYICNAQFDVIAQSDNTIVTDGQSFNFTEASCGYTDPCNWKFAVVNTSTQDINVRIIVDNMVNNNGSDFQVCFAAVCLNSITLNGAYPSVAAVIPNRGRSDVGNNFWNLFPAGTTSDMSWTFRFQAFDASDNEVGTPISMTYNYQGTLSEDTSEIPSLNVFSTQLTEELKVSVDENITATFYDLSGRKVKESNIRSGVQSINVSDLSSQMYLVKFSNELGQNNTIKVIKK